VLVGYGRGTIAFRYAPLALSPGIKKAHTVSRMRETSSKCSVWCGCAVAACPPSSSSSFYCMSRCQTVVDPDRRLSARNVPLKPSISTRIVVPRTRIHPRLEAQRTGSRSPWRGVFTWERDRSSPIRPTCPPLSALPCLWTRTCSRELSPTRPGANFIVYFGALVTRRWKNVGSKPKAAQQISYTR
jgi:hypothetical protein